MQLKNLLIACAFTIPMPLMAQQLAHLAHFNFAPALFNPATAGTTPNWKMGGAFRGQWLGVDGAPNTQVLMADKATDRVGLGFNFRNDKAGSLGITDFSAAYSYKVPVTNTLFFRGGLSAGMANWRNNFSDLRLDDPDDPQFLTNIQRWLPNFGAGIALEDQYWQIGIGVPQLFVYNLNEGADAVAARTFRHYYFHANARFDWAPQVLQFQPQLMVGSASWFNNARKVPRNTVGGPATADVGLSLLILDQWKTGVLWRTAIPRNLSSDHALGIQAGWMPPSAAWNILAIYELPLNAIRRVSDASFEILVTYQLKRTPTPQVPRPAVPTAQMPPHLPEPANNIPPTQAQVMGLNDVQGIIFDMTTGLPCEGARVSLSNNCGQAPVAAFITSADGKYSFQVAPGCCYTVSVQKDHRKTAKSEALCVQESTEGQILRADLELIQQ